MRRFRPILVAWAFLLLGGCVAFHPFPRLTTLRTDLATLPSGRTQDGFLYVTMGINGAGPFKMLVDTGTTGLFVNANVAAAAKLKPLASAVIYGTTDREKAFVSDADAVECGDLVLRGVRTMAVADGNDPLLGSLGFDGIAGLSLFRDVVLVMDFPRRQVRVRRLDRVDFPADRALPYTGLNPIVRLQVAGRMESALIDTGSGFTLIVGGFDSLPFAQPPVKDEGLGGFGLATVVGVRRSNGQLAGEARLGPIRFINPPLREQFPQTAANIGVGALDHLALAFDQRSHRVYFLGSETTRSWAIERYADATHRAGFLGALQDDRIRLAEIDGDGAFARAGLRVGDLILSVDNIPAAKFQMTENWEAAPSRTLKIARGNDRMTIRVSFQTSGNGS